MDTCEIGSCLTDFDSDVIPINTFTTNAFKTGFLLIGYMEECYPLISLLIKILSSIQVFFILSSLIAFGIISLKNSNRISLFEDPGRNAIPWLGTIFITYISLFWMALVPAIQLAFDLAWLSSVSTTLIVWHVWTEFPLAIIGIILLRKNELNWRQVFKRLLILYSFALLNIFLVSLTANPYLQGIFGMLAFVSDFMNPIIYAILTHYTVQRSDRIRLGLMEGIFISHLFNFYFPIIFCSQPFVSAILYIVFQGVNIILTFSFACYVNYTLRKSKLPLPSIF